MWAPCAHYARDFKKFAPAYVFLNYQQFRIRREVKKWLRFNTSELFKVEKKKKTKKGTQIRMEMPVKFVEAVDFMPNTNAPSSVDAGMKQRLCKRNVFFRQEGIGGAIEGDVLHMPECGRHEKDLYNTYRDNIRRWSQWIEENQLFDTNKKPKYSLDEWLEHSNYSGKRKEQLRKRVDRPKDYYSVKTFIKKEAYPDVKPPRTINSRDDAFKVLVGPFTHEVEKDVFGSKFSLKGKTLDQQSRIFYDRMKDKKVFISTDYSRWESSISADIIDEIEMRFFKRYPSPYPWNFHTWLRDHIVNNNLVSRGSNKLKLHGVRMSGDMHTSLMNTYINIYLTAYIMNILGHKWDGFFEGDDGFVGLEDDIADLEFLKNEVRRISVSLGFDLKIDVSRKLQDLPFLSRHCVGDGVCVREPFKAICHAQWSFSLHNHDPAEVVRARGYGLALENKGTPILQELGNLLLRSAGAGKLWYSDPWFKQYYGLPDHVKNVQFEEEVKFETRTKFAELFGIPISTQIKLERDLKNNKLDEVRLVMNSLFSRYRPEWRRNYFKCRDTPTWFIELDFAVE